jgi:hypothetical protein
MMSYVLQDVMMALDQICFDGKTHEALGVTFSHCYIVHFITYLILSIFHV